MDELHRIVGSQFSWRMILPDRNFYLANTNDGWRSFLPSQCEGIYPLVLSFLPSFYPSCPRQRTAFQLPFCMLHFVDCVLSTNWCLRILPLTSPPPLSLSLSVHLWNCSMQLETSHFYHERSSNRLETRKSQGVKGWWKSRSFPWCFILLGYFVWWNFVWNFVRLLGSRKY